MKIKYIMPGQDNKFMRDRIYRACIWEENYDPNFEVTAGDDYDYLIACNSISETSRVPKERIIGVIMEPAWNGCYDKSLDNKVNTIIVHDNSLFNFKNCGVIEHPSLMFTEFYNSSEDIPYYLNTTFEKKEKLNMIVSGASRPGNNLYQKRKELVQSVLKYKMPINIYGRFWTPDGGRLKGGFERKLDIIKGAEFTVAVENSSEKNYISEKFFDAFMVSAVPVYYGCPNITDLYNKDSFIPLDINNIDSCLTLFEQILKMDREPFINILNDMKMVYLRKQNVYTHIINLIKSNKCQ